jgi:hypothetical protein
MATAVGYVPDPHLSAALAVVGRKPTQRRPPQIFAFICGETRCSPDLERQKGIMAGALAAATDHNFRLDVFRLPVGEWREDRVRTVLTTRAVAGAIVLSPAMLQLDWAQAVRGIDSIFIGTDGVPEFCTAVEEDHLSHIEVGLRVLHELGLNRAVYVYCSAARRRPPGDLHSLDVTNMSAAELRLWLTAVQPNAILADTGCSKTATAVQTLQAIAVLPLIDFGSGMGECTVARIERPYHAMGREAFESLVDELRRIAHRPRPVSKIILIRGSVVQLVPGRDGRIPRIRAGAPTRFSSVDESLGPATSR